MQLCWGSKEKVAPHVVPLLATPISFAIKSSGATAPGNVCTNGLAKVTLVVPLLVIVNFCTLLGMPTLVVMKLIAPGAPGAMVDVPPFEGGGVGVGAGDGEAGGGDAGGGEAGGGEAGGGLDGVGTMYAARSATSCADRTPLPYDARIMRSFLIASFINVIAAACVLTFIRIVSNVLSPPLASGAP